MSKIDTAVSGFKEGFNCAQSVLSAFSEELGLTRETALKIACPFGGGMARQAETCGAVTGAFMVIGLKYGQASKADKASKNRTYD